MAKTTKAAEATTEKKVRIKKDNGPKQIQLELSTLGNANIKQTVSHVRNTGVMVTTLVTDDKGKPTGGIHTLWIPGLKPKSKKGERFLVVDKGPKPKKVKAEKKEAKKESK